ncbi:hypothetical protein Tco_1499155 [Tanacetum coccineum]
MGESKHLCKVLVYNFRALKDEVDVPTTQSQPIKSTQGTYRTLSAPRTPNPTTTQGESSAEPTVIWFRILRQPDLETPIPTAVVIDIDTHLVEEEIENLVEGGNNVDVNKFLDEIINDQEDLDTRLEPASHKESLEVKNSVDVLIIHDDDEEEEESARDALIRRKGKGIEEIRDTPPPTPIRSPRTHIAPLSSDKETL